MPSLKRYLRAFWDLFRLEHGLMYGFGVVVGIYVSDPSFSDPLKIIFGYLTAVFLEASTFALNDYLDYDVDLANRRFDRPLVRGEIGKETALISALITLPVGLVFSWFISVQAFLFAFLVTFAGCIYDLKLKEFGFAGNIYIAFTMAAPFIFGSLISTGGITFSSALLSSMAFLTGVGREIMKGIEDIEGDALRGVRSLARLFGSRRAAFAASAFYIAAVAISPIPLLFLNEYFLDTKYALPVAFTDILLLYTALKLPRHHEKELIRKFRKITLIAMLFGLIGFFAGAF